MTAVFGGALAQRAAPEEDAAITARVERAISNDRVLSTLDIKVDTQGGVVRLRGFVNSLGDIAQAHALARAVGGVTGVRSRLRIANRPSRA